jgi:hypothetical protein
VRLTEHGQGLAVAGIVPSGPFIPPIMAPPGSRLRADIGAVSVPHG